MSSKYFFYCGVIAVRVKSISLVAKTQSNLWLWCILLLLIETGDWTLACPQACLYLFSLVCPKRRYCSQALFPLSISYWNNVQNVPKWKVYLGNTIYSLVNWGREHLQLIADIFGKSSAFDIGVAIVLWFFSSTDIWKIPWLNWF